MNPCNLPGRPVANAIFTIGIGEVLLARMASRSA